LSGVLLPESRLDAGAGDLMRKTLRTLVVVGISLAALFLVAPRAHADIIEVEAATSCPGSLGGGLCNGLQPYNLSALLVLLSQPNSIGAGTQKYVVFNDIGNTFSFSMTSTGQNGTGMANNATCQINGGAASLFNGCSIVSSTGQTTTLGGPQINNLTFPATISFSGTAGFGSTFILGFVSMQGSSSVTSAPEPSMLVLLAAGMLGLLGLATTLRPR
jgi:hypothetical protein